MTEAPLTPHQVEHLTAVLIIERDFYKRELTRLSDENERLENEQDRLRAAAREVLRCRREAPPFALSVALDVLAMLVGDEA